jgi:protein-tyrosine phosphatase
MGSDITRVRRTCARVRSCVRALRLHAGRAWRASEDRFASGDARCGRPIAGDGSGRTGFVPRGDEPMTGMAYPVAMTPPTPSTPKAAGVRIALDGTVNTRDLGGWPLRNGAATRFGRVWRSDAFTHATPRDRDRLAEFGVRTVIDLRTVGERADAPHPLATDERFEVVHVDLFGPVLAGFMRGDVTGDPFDLRTHYLASFRLAREAYVQAFAVVARSLATHDGPVVVHCTAGKDRTGLIAALLLRAAGADEATIIAEYALTHERIEPLRPHLLDDGARKGLPRDAYVRMLDAYPETMAETLTALDGEIETLAAEAAQHLR